MTAGHAAFGYHLWLGPEGDALHLLQGVVDRLAEAYGGPVFTPHVTLLSGLVGGRSVVDRDQSPAGRRARTVQPGSDGARSRDDLLPVHLHARGENPSLSRMPQAAGEAFALPADNYMPHLSLYYGDAVSGPSRDAY